MAYALIYQILYFFHFSQKRIGHQRDSLVCSGPAVCKYKAKESAVVQAILYEDFKGRNTHV